MWQSEVRYYGAPGVNSCMIIQMHLKKNIAAVNSILLFPVALNWILYSMPPLMWIPHDIFNYFNICAQYVPVNHICDNSVRQ